MAGTAATSGQGGPATTEAVDRQDVMEILARHGADGLIGVLEEIQTRYGYLPQEALQLVGERTGRSLVDVYGIATFYRAFSLVPRGRHLVCVCLGTACHVRGAPRIVEELERQLGVAAGQTTGDGEFTLETANCLGACALGPVVVIDGRYYSKVKRSQVAQLLQDAAAGLDTAGGQTSDALPVEVSCPRCNHSLMDSEFGIDGRPSIRCSVSCDGRHGWLRLSSLYPSHSVQAEHDIPPGSIASLFCPHCHAQMEGDAICTGCEAAMVPMMIRGGGLMQVCSRHGCTNRMLDLT